MVIVNASVSRQTFERIKEEIAAEPTSKEIEQSLINEGEGEYVREDNIFTKRNGKTRKGFYMNAYLKSNLDNYFIKAVSKKFDGVMLITGMEGTGKSTATFSIAKYCDPTFPGKPLDDGTTRRTCDRIVFTSKDLMEQIDKASPGQAIVMDEAVLSFLAQDASSEVQKVLLKKMVTIRKKRLFIFFVIPSIFLLRMYLAVFRSRALIHFYTPDGLARGFFKFYSYETKRKLYIRGKKDFNQDAHKPDFIGNTTDTEGYFFDVNEYDNKKEAAIKEITEAPKKAKIEGSNMRKRIKGQRDVLIYSLFEEHKSKNPKWTNQNMADELKKRFGFEYGSCTIKQMLDNAIRFLGLPTSVSRN